MKLMLKFVSAALVCTLGTNVSLAGEVLDRVTSTKVLTVATDANFAPQSFLNDKNEMDGFDINIAQEIAKRLGAKAKFITPDWAVITSGHWNGRWDISVGSMAPTKKRSEVLTFPAVYNYSPAVFAVHKDSKIQDLSGLNGKKIAVASASIYQQYLQKELTIDAENAPPFKYLVTTDKLNFYQATNIALDDLRLGDGVRVDAILTDLPSITEAIKHKYPLRVVNPPVVYSPLAVAVDKGDAEFADKLKRIITDMRTDGTLSRLSKKWYGVDSTVAPGG